MEQTILTPLNDPRSPQRLIRIQRAPRRPMLSGSRGNFESNGRGGRRVWESDVKGGRLPPVEFDDAGDAEGTEETTEAGGTEPLS